MVAGNPISKREHLSSLLRMSVDMLEELDRYNAEHGFSLQLRMVSLLVLSPLESLTKKIHTMSGEIQ